jgi:hypothetical protein
MRKLLIVSGLILALFVAGCGGGGHESPEKLMESFYAVVEEGDEEGFKALFTESMAGEDYTPPHEEVWKIITENELTFPDKEYEISEGTFGKEVALEPYTDADGWDMQLILYVYETEGEWLFSGYANQPASWGEEEAAEEEVEEEMTEEEAAAAAEEEAAEALEQEALEHLNAEYLDEVKAMGEKYDASGDIQYYMTFKDGKFDTLHSTATGYGDETAYNNEDLRAELDSFLETLTIPIEEEVKVFWVLEFPIE